MVVLAGDVDEGVRGFRWARETFPDKPVVMVAGNHEFYYSHFTHNLDIMRDAANKYDIDFLEADAVVLAGVTFLGCTLWTDFLLFGEHRKDEALKVAKSTMSDYYYIKNTRTPEQYWAPAGKLIPEQTELRHRGSVTWLSKRLESGLDPAKTVVVTHHAPHSGSIPAHWAGHILSAAYGSDLSALMGRAGLWIHGHVHHSVDYLVDGTRVVCNPRGYPSKCGGMENDAFVPACIVEI